MSEPLSSKKNFWSGFWPKSPSAQRRLGVFLLAAPLLIGAVALSITALKGTEIYFFTPSQLSPQKAKIGQTIRLGGLVAPGSVIRLGPETRFDVIDKVSAIKVSYTGDLPDLFREGQGVVVEGKLTSKTQMTAQTVLAKHDETYMPKNVSDALKEQGEWRPESGMSDAPKKELRFGQSQHSGAK